VLNNRHNYCLRKLIVRRANVEWQQSENCKS